MIPLAGIFLLVLLSATWGGNMVSIKLSSQGVTPILAATIRSVMASCLLFLYCAYKQYPFFLKSRQMRHGLAIGMLFGIEFLILYYGLSLTSVSRAVIFLYTQPLWTALGAHYLVTQENLSAKKSAGLIISFLGIIFVFGSKASGVSPLYWVGDIMEVAAGFLWAATTVYIKRFMSDEPISHYQTLFAQLFFSIPVLFAGWALIEYGAPLDFKPVVIGALVYQGVIVAFISYLGWFWMIQKHQIMALAAFTFLTPMFGVILSALVLGESIAPVLWMGLGMVSVGIYLVNKP
jgi:drug/metabolite transporter (DMT)-like permease